ncbi:MAG: VWA domain-containing protein, partial [Victivallales bacterium]|nr:VWA domain-containing protein [Victivallales bacterium]
CLENLNVGDRFEIIRFSTEAEPFFGKLMKAKPAVIEKAVEYVDALKPIGGTAIHEALTEAMRLRPASSGGKRPYHVVFLTDGLPTIGETAEEAIVKAVSDINGQTRVFSFGIGTGVNTHLLDRIAQKTCAVSQYVLPEEDLELKLSSFYTKISEPIMTDIKLKFTRRDIRVSKLYPHELPDLFNGDQLLVFGRYSGTGPSTVKINGNVNGKNSQIVQDIVFPKRESAPFIPVIWATRRIGWLLDEIRIHGESDELKDEITKLARRYGVVTPYTAYLIMEDETIRDVPVGLRNMREFGSDSYVQENAKNIYLSLGAEAADESIRAGAPAVFNSMDVR